MPNPSNPFHQKVLGDVTLTAPGQTEAQFITTLIQQGLKDDTDRNGWLERQRALTRLRHGIRKPKTFPWRGASNLNVPFIDSSIRKYKPALFRLFVEPDPLVTFTGMDPAAVDAEHLVEQFFTWLFKSEMAAIEPMAYIIDCFCHRGYSIAQVGWDYHTELETRVIPVRQLFGPQPPTDPNLILQKLSTEYNLDLDSAPVLRSLKAATDSILAGAESVKVAFKKVISNRPCIWDRDPVQVIVSSRCTDLPNAERVIVQHIFPLRKVEQMEADGYFKRGTVAAIKHSVGVDAGRREMADGMDAGSSSLSQERRVEDEKERIWGSETTDTVLLWEVFHWHDIDNDGLQDRVHTWLHPKSNTKCTSHAYAYPFHAWPFVKYDFEKTHRRFHSPRGISFMLADLQREMSTQHNQRIDGMTLRNSPCYQVPVSAGFKSRNFRAIPGTVIHTNPGIQIVPLVQDRGAFPEQVREEQNLRAIGEQYVGIFDTALTSPTSQTSARTATEVNAVMQYQAATSTMDAILFQVHMTALYQMIWELWLDMGPDEVFIKVQSEDPNRALPVGRLVKKGEIAHKYRLSPTGTLLNTNRALQLNNAQTALQIFLQDQSGFINEFELRKAYLSLLDPRLAQRILNPPAAATAQRTMAQAAAAVAKNPELRAKLGMGPDGAQFEPGPETSGPEMAQVKPGP